MSKYDPTFYKRFGIKSTIHYVWDVIVEKGLEKRFAQDWKRFYPRAKSLVSKTRKKSLLPTMNRIYQNQSDAMCSDRIQIRFINKNVGYGVFAKCDIAPYSVLNHYAGILRLDEDIEEENDSTFNFTNFRKYSIDAVHSGNWTRFINHADIGDPKNNVVPWELYLPQGPRFVFSAGCRGIRKGEQLLYSYGDYYWEDKESVIF